MYVSRKFKINNITPNTFYLFTYFSLSRPFCGFSIVSDLAPQVSGSSLFPDWFPIWQVEMALSHNAIVISPNYRFLPESNGQDIMQDVEDFWKWLISDFEDFFQDHVPDGVTPDFSRILTAGESAGKAYILFL